MNTICNNCGRPINRKTLICEYCGTDYNEYDPVPKCEHVYDKVYACQNIKDLTTNLTFHCKNCGEEAKTWTSTGTGQPPLDMNDYTKNS